MRKLSEYYQFNIEIKKAILKDGKEYWYHIFTKSNGEDLPDYKSKLTPSQWMRAKKYLTRELIPFAGYRYEVKPEYQKEAIYKIK